MRKLFSLPTFFVLSITASVAWVYLYSGGLGTYITSAAMTILVCFCSYRWLLGPRSSDPTSKALFILLAALCGLGLFFFFFTSEAVSKVGEPVVRSMFTALTAFVILYTLKGYWRQQDEIDKMLADDDWDKEMRKEHEKMKEDMLPLGPQTWLNVD